MLVWFGMTSWFQSYLVASAIISLLVVLAGYSFQFLLAFIVGSVIDFIHRMNFYLMVYAASVLVFWKIEALLATRFTSWFYIARIMSVIVSLIIFLIGYSLLHCIGYLKTVLGEWTITMLFDYLSGSIIKLVIGYLISCIVGCLNRYLPDKYNLRYEHFTGLLPTSATGILVDYFTGLLAWQLTARLIAACIPLILTRHLTGYITLYLVVCISTTIFPSYSWVWYIIGRFF